jgi:hypothetical protein
LKKARAGPMAALHFTFQYVNVFGEMRWRPGNDMVLKETGINN